MAFLRTVITALLNMTISVCEVAKTDLQDGDQAERNVIAEVEAAINTTIAAIATKDSKDIGDDINTLKTKITEIYRTTETAEAT
jgi:hypothetical protein